MKFVLLMTMLFFILSCTAVPSYFAVTTTDNSITLDFYEDTQSGIPNRWILDFTINDLGSFHPDYFKELTFSLKLTNRNMKFHNEHNNLDSNYFDITEYRLVDPNGFPVVFEQYIYTASGDLPTPAGTEYVFYSMLMGEGEPIIGTFTVDLSYTKNIGSAMHEQLTLTGPIGFAPVPEPMSMLLFVFGTFFLKYLK